MPLLQPHTPALLLTAPKGTGLSPSRQVPAPIDETRAPAPNPVGEGSASAPVPSPAGRRATRRRQQPQSIRNGELDTALVAEPRAAQRVDGHGVRGAEGAAAPATDPPGLEQAEGPRAVWRHTRGNGVRDGPNGPLRQRPLV